MKRRYEIGGGHDKSDWVVACSIPCAVLNYDLVGILINSINPATIVNTFQIVCVCVNGIRVG